VPRAAPAARARVDVGLRYLIVAVMGGGQAAIARTRAETRDAGASLRRPGALAIALAALLAAGCANVYVGSPLDDPRAPSTTAVKRCSPDDPNRSAWFCKVGQLIYNIVGGGQVSGGYTIR
jgi:hypothetical protein